jgi:hypothetical protein
MPTLCSPLALCIITFWAVVVVAGLVTLLLAFRGVAALPFIVYIVLTGAADLFLFQPLAGTTPLPVAVMWVIMAVMYQLVVVHRHHPAHCISRGRSSVTSGVVEVDVVVNV